MRGDLRRAGGGPREPQGGRWRTTGAVKRQVADYESRVAGYENRVDGMKGPRPLKTVMSGAPVRVPTTPEYDPVETGGYSINTTITTKGIGESIGVSETAIHPCAEDGGSVGTGPVEQALGAATGAAVCIFEDLKEVQSDASATNLRKSSASQGSWITCLMSLSDEIPLVLQ